MFCCHWDRLAEFRELHNTKLHCCSEGETNVSCHESSASCQSQSYVFKRNERACDIDQIESSPKNKWHHVLTLTLFQTWRHFEDFSSCASQWKLTVRHQQYVNIIFFTRNLLKSSHIRFFSFVTVDSAHWYTERQCRWNLSLHNIF